MSSRNKNIVFILTAIAIAYFPLWSSAFSLKNDFYTQYFLQRFFIGESISEKNFPLWNPYFNYGLPVYNDMNGGFWYPLTWINSLLTGYTAHSFALEEVLHFPIAAAGMYLLARYFGLGSTTKLMAAISYACCGYFVAHTQHYNWITGAAWLPWCMLALYRCMDQLSVKNLCLGTLAFALFISSSHPGLIIGGIYFFALMGAIHLFEKEVTLRKLKNIVPLLLLVLICMGGLIYSYTEIIPLFTRSGKISPEVIMNFSTPPRSFFSFLLPLPFTQTAGEGEEITMNNLYLGLWLIISVIAGITRNRKRSDYLYLAVAAFFFLISTNLSLSHFIITRFPLLQYVRLNGEMRIFGMVAFMMYGAIQFDHLVRNHHRFLRNTCFVLAASLAATGLFTMFLSSGTASLITRLPALLISSANRESLKEAIHVIGFSEAIVIQSFLQCILLLLLAISLEKKQQWIKWIVAADMILATLLNMPFTGVSMRPVSTIQSLLDKSPHGFPLPYAGPEQDIYQRYPQTDTLTGNWSFYGKQIAIDEWSHYPMILQSTRKYFDSTHSSLKKSRKPFAFTEDGQQIVLEGFSPQTFSFIINAEKEDRLFVKQNLYPGWEFFVNKKKIQPDTAFYAFPAIRFPAGKNEVTMDFRKPMVTALFIFYWVMLTAMTLVLLAGTLRRYNRN